MRDTATKICKLLQDNGFEAVFAGGVVRDMIMGKEPHDIDIATSATPEKVMAILSAKRIQCKEMGKAFGVVGVTIGDLTFEIATFRIESEYSDGRHPDKVSFATMEEDASRRDLTINSIFFDPISGNFHDFLNGKEDIRNKIIRFVGNANERIEEDKLRMLRAVRFAVKFDFAMAPDSMQAIKNHASEIGIISVERIQQELIKMFELDNPSKVFELLMETGLMKEILPEVAAIEGVRQSIEWHPEGPVDVHTKLVMGAIKGNWRARFAAMLHDIGKPATFSEENGKIRSHGHDKVGAEMAEKLLLRLKFSTDDIVHITSIISDHMKLHEASEMKKSTLRRLISTPHFNDLFELDKADVLSGGGTDHDRKEIKFIETFIENLKNEKKLPPPLVSGMDLIQLGLKPGPLFREILEAVSDLQLEGEITSREEGIEFVRRKYL